MLRMRVDIGAEPSLTLAVPKVPPRKPHLLGKARPLSLGIRAMALAGRIVFSRDRCARLAVPRRSGRLRILFPSSSNYVQQRASQVVAD